MGNHINSREVTVLMVSDKESEIQDVKNHLEKTMGYPCRIWHCPSTSRSAGFFKNELPGIDIVLLDLDVVASGLPREIFLRMQNIAEGVPIIVFTARKDHGLALMVVEAGAADNITKGQFSSDPYKLRDAIEFSLARDDISKKTKKENADNVAHIGDLRAEDIKSMKQHETVALEAARADAIIVLNNAFQHGNIVLREAKESGERKLREANAASALVLKEFQDESAVRHLEKDQIIHWMGGGYSM